MAEGKYQSADRGSKKASLLSGLVDKKDTAKKPAAPQSGGFLTSEREREVLRKGGVPAGWSRDKDGRPRPMVQ